MKRGMTIIEALIYMALLSFLVTSSIYFAYDLHFQDVDLFHEIENAQNS